MEIQRGSLVHGAGSLSPQAGQGQPSPGGRPLVATCFCRGAVLSPDITEPVATTPANSASPDGGEVTPSG